MLHIFAFLKSLYSDYSAVLRVAHSLLYIELPHHLRLLSIFRGWYVETQNDMVTVFSPTLTLHHGLRTISRNL